MFLNAVRRSKKVAALALFGAFSLVGSGCSVLYKPLASTINAYSEDIAISDFLRTNDVDMMCRSGDALGSLVDSFAQTGVSPDKVALTLYLLSAFCENERAHYLHMESLLAAQAGNGVVAQSYMALSQRSLASVSRRQYTSYELAMSAYPVTQKQPCPDFATEQDELLFMLGNLQGLEALINDGKSGGLASVPKSTANAIFANMQCVNNEAWWGTPQAVRAALTVFLPELDRELAKRSDEVLNESVALGRKLNTPLAETVALGAWVAQSKPEQIQQLLQEHYEYRRNADYNPRWMAVALISNRHLDHHADSSRIANGQAVTSNPAAPFIYRGTKELNIDLDDL